MARRLTALSKPRYVGTKDNAGAMWVKQHTNFIRTLTLEGMEEKQLIRTLFLHAGLLPNKAKELLFQLSELGLIVYDGVIVRWNEEPKLSEDDIQRLRKKAEEKMRERPSKDS
jgi:hypothetical protein